MNASMSILRRFANRPFGPVVIALGLGWLSSPFAALSVATSAEYPSQLSLDQAVPMTLMAVTAGALAGGSLGGRIVRTRPIAGFSFALLVAWPVAIATLPILPAVLGWTYDGPSTVTARAPASAIPAYVESLLFAPFGAIVGGILAWIGNILADRDHRVIAIGLAAAAFVGLNFWSIALYAPAAAIALIVGSFAWVALYWAGPNRAAGSAAPP